MAKHRIELNGYCQVGWFRDLQPWGIATVQGWFNPVTEDWAYLYKHKSGAVHIAKTYEEQMEVHRLYGIPTGMPGAHFSEVVNRDPMQMSLFEEAIS